MARLTISSIRSQQDGYPLQIALYRPYDAPHPETVAVINSGAGISKFFYEPFAGWLADNGVPVITYDYRGIGGSRGKSVRGLRASIYDWGSKDCAAVLEHAQGQFPTSSLCVISHSIGGIVTGFVTHPPEIKRMLLLSPHTGYAGDYAAPSRLKMFLLWHLAMPVLAQAVGFFPGRAFGLKEDLPLGVARDWGARRFRRSLRLDSRIGSFRQIRANVLVVRPDDDPFATVDASSRVQLQYPECRFSEIVLNTSSRNSTWWGHFAFFTPTHRDAWPMALKWLVSGAL